MLNFVKWIIRILAHYLAHKWAEAQALARGLTGTKARAVGWAAGTAASVLVDSVLSA
jgi:hypothetical protein